MANTTLIEDGCLADECDVTIYLMPIESTTSKLGIIKKRKYNHENLFYYENRLSYVNKISGLDSSKLRQCSKYFEVCLSNRWKKDQCTKMKFHLEVQTEIKYYHDCFSRMYFPFKPILNVSHCIELLKVALQIQYDEVIDIGMKYLSSIHLSDQEKKQVQDFCFSNQLSRDSTSELYARMGFHSNEEREKNHSNAICELLQLSLRRNGWKSGRYKKCQRIFKKVFHRIVTNSRPTRNCSVLHNTVTFIVETLERMLICIKEKCRDLKSFYMFEFGVEMIEFCWLYGVLQVESVAHPAADLILNDEELPQLLMTTFDTWALLCDLSRHPRLEIHQKVEVEEQWAELIYSIFHGALVGNLFLETSKRLTLFKQWNWILNKVNLIDELRYERNFNFPNKPPVATIIANFVASFPYAQQKEIYDYWLKGLGNPSHKNDFNLEDSHMAWMEELMVHDSNVEDNNI